MIGTEIQEEIIARMMTILGPPQPVEGSMILIEEWAGDWKLWMYCYFSRGNYSITSYNHKLKLSGLSCADMNTDRSIKWWPETCIEILLPALRKATVLSDLASI